MSTPALLVSLPFLGGAVGAILLFDGLDPRFPLIAAASALLALIAASGFILQDDSIGTCCAIGLGCALAGASSGASAAREAYRPPLLQWFDRAMPREPTVLEGVLREDAAPVASGVSLNLDVVSVDGYREKNGPLGGVRLTVGGTLSGRDRERWRAGRTIRAPAFLRRPSTYLNPGLPDETRALARRGIVLVGGIKSGALVEVVRSGHPLSELAAALRSWTRARVTAHLAGLDARSAGVTTAVLIGDRSGLEPEDERRLQEAGTYHVIAISGGNIAILAVLALSLCRAMLMPSRTAAVLTALALMFYGVVAAGAASVTRAVTVAALVLAARALDHRAVPLNVLAMAALAAAAAAPVALLDAGFILSFGATVAIILGVPMLVGVKAQRRSGIGRAVSRVGVAVATLFAATVCAEVALAPVAATFFSRITFAGFLLNFAAIPLMAIVQVAGLLLVALSPWSEKSADSAAWVAHLAAAGLLQSARAVELAPWLATTVRPPVWWVIVCYYGGAIALLLPRVRRHAASLLGLTGVVMLAGPHVATRDGVPRGARPLRVVILDVGQGDSTVLQLPGGRALLVDAGGLASFSSPDAEGSAAAFDIGDRVIAPALGALAIARLDGIVVTHGDPDHVQGARGVLRRVPAATLWEGVPVPPHAGLQGLWSFARARGMTWRTVQAGDADRFDDAEIRVLHPPLPDWERQRVRNEDSVVLEIRLGRVSIVLPGDIGREGERAILPKIEPGRLVILKAPHHGSATSSTKELLQALRPSAVVFSCGRDNRFGHPHPAVVARYQELGSAMFSTAEDGAVFVETDGTKVQVRGWKGRRVVFDAAHR